jgi:Mg2+ and Co2+ transporter CorA
MPGSNRGPLVACAAYAGGCRVADVAIEDIFGEAVSRDTTMRIYTLKRDLLEIKRGVSPLVDICNRLMRTDLDLIPDDARARTSATSTTTRSG